MSERAEADKAGGANATGPVARKIRSIRIDANSGDEGRRYLQFTHLDAQKVLQTLSLAAI